MSSIGFNDLSLWSDALSENGFKPWWETIRSYIVATMYASAFFLIYEVQPEDAIHCRPPANLSNTLSEDDTVYVNSVCFGQLNLLHANVGSISLAACLVIHLSYSWWLMIPRVSKTFSKIRRADVKLEGVKLGAESLRLKARHLCFHPDVPIDKDLGISHEDASTITDVCADLWNPRSESLLTIRIIYFLRNLSVLGPLSFSIYMCVFLIIAPESSFTCKVDIITYSAMQCNHNLSTKIFPFLITFTVCQVVLVMVSLVTIIAQARIYTRLDTSDKDIEECNQSRRDTSDNDIEENNQSWQDTPDEDIEHFNQFRAKEDDYHFVSEFSKHSTSLSRKIRGILCITDVLPEVELKQRLKDEFASSFRIFLWDLDGKVFLKKLDKYREVRKLCVQVLAGNSFKKFVDGHHELINNPNTRRARNNPSVNIDPCRCRYLFAKFKKTNLQERTQEKKSLFQYVFEAENITELQIRELFTHFLENLPPKLIKYGAHEVKRCLVKKYDGRIPELFTKLLTQYRVNENNSASTNQI